MKCIKYTIAGLIMDTIELKLKLKRIFREKFCLLRMDHVLELCSASL